MAENNALVTISKDNWLDKVSDPAYLIAMKDMVAPKATVEQFAVFINTCQAGGLNPFLKEVWWLPVNNGMVVISRDGRSKIANNHPQYDGMQTYYNYNGDSVWTEDIITAKDAILSAVKVVVWRKDRKHPSIGIATWADYGRVGNDAPAWKYKHTMLETRAMCIAMKKAFPVNGLTDEDDVVRIQEAVETQTAEVVGNSTQQLASIVPTITKPVETKAETKTEVQPTLPLEDEYDPKKYEASIRANLQIFAFSTIASAKPVLKSMSNGACEKILECVATKETAELVLHRSNLLASIKSFITESANTEADVIQDISFSKATTLLDYVKMSKEDVGVDVWERIETWTNENIQQ